MSPTDRTEAWTITVSPGVTPSARKSSTSCARENTRRLYLRPVKVRVLVDFLQQFPSGRDGKSEQADRRRGTTEAAYASTRGRCRMPKVRPLEDRHPDGVRRGTGERALDARR